MDSYGKKAGKGALISEDASMTLGTSQDQYLFQPVTDRYILDDQGGRQISVRKDGTSPTLRAETHGNIPCVLARTFIVRRLTPLECCRLQGFPDYWCDGLDDQDPSAEEVRKWIDIFDEYNRATGKPNAKKKTEKQIRKWLANPYSDSAMYKMWGNGVALPCVSFIMQSIKKQYEEDI